MPLFLDANVWLPLVWEGHAACRATREWADSQTEDFSMCRVTQLALLRHLTNPAILGEDALANTEASLVVEALMGQPSIRFNAEPGGMEPVFPRLGETDSKAHLRWTDSYLAAFAIAGNLELVTYDRGFHRYEKEGLRWTLLKE